MKVLCVVEGKRLRSDLGTECVVVKFRMSLLPSPVRPPFQGTRFLLLQFHTQASFCPHSESLLWTDNMEVNL